MEVHIQPQTLSETIIDKVLPSHSSSNPNITVTPIPAALIDSTFSTSTNITTTVLGASILGCSDEYFASASNLLTPTPPIRKPGYFVETGAWYDGWETRRHNQKEFDWVVIRLGCVARIEAVEVDTAYFNGNEAPRAGLDGINATTLGEEDESIKGEGFGKWEEVLPPSKCGPSQRQAWKVSGAGVQGKEFTHLRLKQYPDGGIARLRVYGTIVPPPLPAKVLSGEEERPLEDLAAALNGGVAISCSDQHFGGKHYLVLPGRGKDMGDGWETARSRTSEHTDWVIIRLGLKGRKIEKIIVDTKDFKGNFPRAVKVEGWATESAKAALGTETDPKADGGEWKHLIKGEQSCQAHREHEFEGEQLALSEPPEGHVWTHVKMTIIPDGGVKRLRIFGRRA
jgi:allantoicase